MTEDLIGLNRALGIEVIRYGLRGSLKPTREINEHTFLCGDPDGRLWPVTDMIFVEARVPGYGEVDFEAGMDAAAIRARYPELVIWGNISGDRLRRGSQSEVHDHCMTVLEGSAGQAYFHGCSNTVLPGTPVENVLAMMRTRDGFCSW